MADEQPNHLLETRSRAAYNEAEQRFSCLLYKNMQDLLEGRRNRLDLLRRYHNDPSRLGIMSPLDGIAPEQLRLPVIETLLRQALRFVCADTMGGPIAQSVGRDGITVEVREFSTKYPHIVVERIDRYADGAVEPTTSFWRLKRVQNQRRQTQINRVLDATNLLLDLVRMVR